MIPFFHSLDISSGRGLTQPRLQSAFRWFPLLGLSRCINGRVVTWVVLVLAGILIRLLLRLRFRLFVIFWSVRHLRAPCRGSRRSLNPPVYSSFLMLAMTEGSAE